MNNWQLVEAKTKGGKSSPIYIHVNQHNIRKSIKGEDLPVITVKCSDKNVYGYEVKITGESEVIYGGAGNKPLLSCGARVVIKTFSDVYVKTHQEEQSC